MCRMKLNMEFFSENISMKMQFLQLSFISNIHFKVKFDWNELNYYASVVKYMGQEDREKESYYTFQYMMRHQKAFPFHRSRCKSLSWLPANISSEYRICRIFPLLMCLLSLARVPWFPLRGDIYGLRKRQRCPPATPQNWTNGETGLWSCTCPAQYMQPKKLMTSTWALLQNWDTSWIIHKIMYS